MEPYQRLLSAFEYCSVNLSGKKVPFLLLGLFRLKTLLSQAFFSVVFISSSIMKPVTLRLFNPVKCQVRWALRFPPRVFMILFTHPSNGPHSMPANMNRDYLA